MKRRKQLENLFEEFCAACDACQDYADYGADRKTRDEALAKATRLHRQLKDEGWTPGMFLRSL